MEGPFDVREGVSNTHDNIMKPTESTITFGAREIPEVISHLGLPRASEPSEYETDPHIVLLRIELLLQRIVDFLDRIAIPSWLIKK